MNVHFWPFMLPGATGQLAEVYRSVADLMMDIVESKEDENRRWTFVHVLEQICKLVVGHQNYVVVGAQGNVFILIYFYA